MPTVLFVCEGNQFRSQIAEAFFNVWAPPEWRAESAGTAPKRSVANPAAVELMAEMGIDISQARPKPIDLAVAERAWRVIAMCAPDACPVQVRNKMEHWGVVDPADLPPERWFEIRDEIAERVKALIREIGRTQPASQQNR